MIHKDKITLIAGVFNQFSIELDKSKSLDDLENLWRKFFGNKGIIKLLLKDTASLPLEEKRKELPKIQKLYKEAMDSFEEKKQRLVQLESKERLEIEKEELSNQIPKIGHLHPITRTIRAMNDFFIKMGYSIMDGPEIEQDEYCFKRLNVPMDHPARDMQDTIYIDEPNYLLCTQTSSIEARTLENYKPPLKVVSPGRVYRNEKVNKSNHFIFHHYQGFVVLPLVSLKDLFGTLNLLFKKMYGEEVIVRYRNKYYPEVEPGVGSDMQCFKCKGHGCNLCKGLGWIEMGGAGIIHPEVLKMAGIDNHKFMGFAFGLGLDRWVMAKYNISDIRTLLGGNLGYKYYENESII